MMQPPSYAPVTQGFGNRPDWDPEFYAQWGYPGHNGVDYGCEAGSPVMAVVTGKLYRIGYEDGGFGQFAVQDGGDCWWYYCHLTRDGIYNRVGEVVQQGRAFCNSGFTGAVYPAGAAGAHLHFGRRLKSYPTNDPWKGWRDPWKPSADSQQPTGSKVRVKAEMYPRLRQDANTSAAILVDGLSPGTVLNLLDLVDSDGRQWAKVACYVAKEFVEALE